MEPFSALLAICVRGIHQWRGDLMISLISAWINGWVNNGDLRRHPAHCDVTVTDDSVVVMTTIDFHSTMLQGEIIWQLSHLSWILGKHFSDMIITKNQNDRSWKNKVHDGVIKWKHFPRYWPFVRGIHRSPVNSPHKGQGRGSLMFSLICAWINGWINNREAGDLRRQRAHYDVIVMTQLKY